MIRSTLVAVILGGCLSAATLDYSCTFERTSFGEPGPVEPTCTVDVEDYGVTVSADTNVMYASGYVKQLSGVCIGCGDAYVANADISFSHAETWTVGPIGGTGMARLVDWTTEWQDANDGDAGSHHISFTVPGEIDRSLPFDITLQISASGQLSLSDSGGLYIGGSHVRAWQFEDVVHSPEPSTYMTMVLGLLLVLLCKRRAVSR